MKNHNSEVVPRIAASTRRPGSVKRSSSMDLKENRNIACMTPLLPLRLLLYYRTYDVLATVRQIFVASPSETVIRFPTKSNRTGVELQMATTITLEIEKFLDRDQPAIIEAVGFDWHQARLPNGTNGAFSIIKYVDNDSPVIFRAAVSRKVYPMTLYMRSGTANRTEIFQAIRLEGALINSVDYLGRVSDEKNGETVEITVDSYKSRRISQRSDGAWTDG